MWREGNVFPPCSVKPKGLDAGGETIDASDEDLITRDCELLNTVPVGLGNDIAPVRRIGIGYVDTDDAEIRGGDVGICHQLTSHEERNKATFDVMK